ncbi:MAG: SDR family NAD(P)-dependent oxidoreductase [Deltaproteobacteria bacterium]|nr:SDR family NAD(P)-dependent oxidoreductase [Deltaproteobacteria bacterium]
MTTHAVVTGAAGAIGAAIAKSLVRRDPRVKLTLIDVAEDRARALARSLGPDHEALAWDLADVDGLEAQLSALVARRGSIDTLINCAGVMEIRSFAGTPWSIGERLVAIDLLSPLRLMSLVVPEMRARGRGTIVNVSSMAGVTPLRGCSYYGAAKAGLAMASEIAHLELAPEGVHVVTVYPGPVRSELERRARAQARPGLVASLLPTGDASALAERVIEACERRRARVFYPALYDVAGRFPAIASRVTRAFSPLPIA